MRGDSPDGTKWKARECAAECARRSRCTHFIVFEYSGFTYGGACLLRRLADSTLSWCAEGDGAVAYELHRGVAGGCPLRDDNYRPRGDPRVASVTARLASAEFLPASLDGVSAPAVRAL